MHYKKKETENMIKSTLIGIKKYIKCDEIILCKSSNNKINYCTHTNTNINIINTIFNNYINKININKYNELIINDKYIHKINIIPIKINENIKYTLLIINNPIESIEEKNRIIKIYQDSLQIILNEIELIQELKQKTKIEKLTNLGNRFLYEEDIQKIINRKFTYILIDLFRLKHVNDNINHAAGDKYLQITAHLLQQNFPKYKYTKAEKETTLEVATGDSIYRIGGDEFVLISQNKSKEEIINKLETIKRELNKISLNRKQESLLSINYGIVERNNNEPIEELYKESDKQLGEDKNNIYKSLKLIRRI